MSKILSKFDPLVSDWFSANYQKPTEIQSLAWNKISRGEHVLVTAPTGSGKTLTAFLWGLNQLITKKWMPGTVRIVYVSPLKALNNDIKKNLTVPLEGLRSLASKKGITIPEIGVAVRSGDTTTQERRLTAKKPPEIFITTPESLNIILSSPRGRSMLTGVKLFISDEIHSVAGTKRGVHLAGAVERLSLLSGEFQRIALSATVSPLNEVAAFIGGYISHTIAGQTEYEPRKVVVVKASKNKEPRCTVCSGEIQSNEEDWLTMVVDKSLEIIKKHKTTLLFANSRRMVEKIARLINERAGEEIAFSHHGSLSREIRSLVEERLKSGELKALVATGSLELGIDIGDVEFVVLIQTPRGVNAAIQRIGRSNHTVDGISEGAFLPTHGRDFLEAAVTAWSVKKGYIEPIHIPLNPLDMLAQLILSICSVDEWHVEDLYAFIKTIYNYQTLKKTFFEIVVEMLCGRYAGLRVRELSAKLNYDRIDGTVRSRDGIRFQLYSSGGAIPDRGLYNMKLQSNGYRIGTLDEEFVWERNIGDTFALGVQCWVIKKITHNDVEVAPAVNRPGIIPFWRAEQESRHFSLSKRLLELLKECELILGTDHNLPDNLFIEKYQLSRDAASRLADYIARQRDITGCALPNIENIVVEHCSDPENTTDNKQVIIHTMWGRCINMPAAYAISSWWESEYGYPLEVFINNDAILLQLPHKCNGRELFDAIINSDIQKLIRRHIEKTGLFGSVFRENASRALLLPPKGFKNRQPLWLNRLRAKKILESVKDYSDFPVMIETWRTLLCDIFDMDNLALLLDKIEAGEIKISECITRAPSPFCDDLVWNQVNKYMYQDDTPSGGIASSLSDSLIRDITRGFLSRVAIDRNTIEILDSRLKRTFEGYAAFNTADLIGWIDERVVVTQEEWHSLLAARERDRKKDEVLDMDKISCVIAKFRINNTVVYSYVQNCAIIKRYFPDICGTFESIDEKNSDIIVQRISKIMQKSNNIDFSSLFKQFLSYYAVFDLELVKMLFADKGVDILNTLLADNSVISDRLCEESSETFFTVRENYEILLRMQRRSRRPGLTALPVKYLQDFLAEYQNLGSGKTVEDLQNSIEQLCGLPLESQLWEEAVFTARIADYTPLWLDSLISSTDLICCGAGKAKFTFIFNEECPVFKKGSSSDESDEYFGSRPFSFSEFASRFALTAHEGLERLYSAFFRGKLICTGFDHIRKATINRFKTDVLSSSLGRVSFGRWKSSQPTDSLWRALVSDPVESEFENLELEKERARQLLSRYGVIFRQLTDKEDKPLRWAAVFRALRLMELSGEIVSGYFFEGVDSLQFVSQEGLRFFTEFSGKKNRELIYWFNAKDPASLAGCDIDYYKENMPRRIASNYVVYGRGKPVLVCEKNFSRLRFLLSPEESEKEHLKIFRDILGRRFNPPSKIRVDFINGEPAHISEYSSLLISAGFRKDYRSLVLERNSGYK